MIRTHDLMRRGVIFCYPDDSAKQVAEIMHSNRIRSLAVVDEVGELWGSISRNDLLQLYGKDLEKVKARDVLQPYKMDIDPQTPIEEAVAIMEKYKFDYLLITEPYTTSKRLVGILTSYDIVRYMSGIESGYYEHLLKIHKD